MVSIYNTFKYGEELYYGSAQANAALLWNLAIDWAGNGSFEDGYNEALHLIDVRVVRGRDHVLGARGRGWERFQPGSAVFTLDNTSGRYDPYNALGPLYGDISPGRYAHLSVWYDGTEYDIIRGVVNDIQPYNQGKQRFVRISVVDGLQWLAERTFNKAVANNIESGVLISGILTAAGRLDTEWGMQLLSNGKQVSRTYYWRRPALSSVYDLCDVEGGQFWHRANGDFAFADSAYGFASTTAIDESEVLVDIGVSQPWELIRNDIEIVEHTYIDTVSSSIELWKLQSAVPIPVASTIAMDGLFSYLHYGRVGGRSLGSGSFTANSASDGSGTDITASCVMTRELACGDGTLFTFTNNSGMNGYITAAALTGMAVYSPNITVYGAEDTTSQGKYGKRTFRLDVPWLQGGGYAQAYADWVLSELKDPKPMIKIMIENRFEYQLGLELFMDGIAFTSATLGIDDTFRIGKIEHRWLRENGQAMRTTYTLEPRLTAFDYP